jgi:hypothetical protein
MNKLNSIRIQRAGQIFDFFNTIYPVGYVYPQYPGQKNPNELWGEISTWEALDYKGAFFRAGNIGETSDSNALPFEKAATVARVDEANRNIIYMDAVYGDIKEGCILYDPNSNNSWLVSKNETANNVSKVTLTTSVSDSIILTNILIGQEDSFQTHTHTYTHFDASKSKYQIAHAGYYNFGWSDSGTFNTTGRHNEHETRSVNFTYILWKRIS